MTDKAGTEGLEAELRLIHVRMTERTGMYNRSTELLNDASKLIAQHSALVTKATELLSEADALKPQIEELHAKSRKLIETVNAEQEVDDARAEEIIAALELLGK